MARSVGPRTARTKPIRRLKPTATPADQITMTLRVVSQVTVRLQDGVLTVGGTQPQVQLQSDGER